MTSSQDAACDTESSQALSASDDASNNNENWWYSSFFLTVPCGGRGEAVIASTEITSDGETNLLTL